MERVRFLSIFLLFSTTFLTVAGAKNNPTIFTKDGSVHIRSGDNGNIVFEHPSPSGKVIVGGQELNVINSTGPKGEKGEVGTPGTSGTLGIKGQIGDKGEPGRKGDVGEKGHRGLPGTNGTLGLPGEKGARGDPGLAGRNGSQGPAGRPGNIGTPGLNGSIGPPGLKGDFGQVGKPGSPGPPGPSGFIGPKGLPGVNGTVGEKGSNGSPGIKGDNGDTSYYRGNESDSIQCNSTNFGILRYSSTKLQLCTPQGWRYLSFEPLAGCSNIPDVPNVPETNYQAFRDANLGVMLEFNRQFVPNVISRANLNITADISPVNSTLSYEDAVMRQAALFSGKTHLTISGISDDFWRNSNWSVMTLLKYKDIGQANIMVLGHGKAAGNQGFHLGIRGKDKTAIHGYYSNDITYGVVKEDRWYHLTYTSEKDLQGKETRCIIINGHDSTCSTKPTSYHGSGATTVGTWWHEKLDDYLLLDNLIIISGIVRYKNETAGEKQVCFARTLDEKLP